MSKRGVWLCTGVCLAAVLLITYLNYSYFFNPLTFKQSAITNLPWRWYRNPLQLEYAVLDDDGWKLFVTADQAEIDLVFSELQQGVSRAATMLDDGGKQIWFGVRRQADGAILLSVDAWEQTSTCLVDDQTPVVLTERLQQLLQERLEQARTSTAARQHPPAGT